MEPRAPMHDLQPFLADLASSAPVPGGGSVAALDAATGSALLVMVCSLTLGRKRFEDVEDRVQEIRARADVLGNRARELVDEDATAYSRVAEAMSLPRETDDDRQERASKIQLALKGAAVPPLETMRVAAEVANLAEALVKIGNPSAITDVGTAALQARAAFHAARLNVLINLSAVKDASWVDATKQEAESIPDPAAVCAHVLADVVSVLNPQ